MKRGKQMESQQLHEIWLSQMSHVCVCAVGHLQSSIKETPVSCTLDCFHAQQQYPNDFLVCAIFCLFYFLTKGSKSLHCDS